MYITNAFKNIWGSVNQFDFLIYDFMIRPWFEIIFHWIVPSPLIVFVKNLPSFQYGLEEEIILFQEYPKFGIWQYIGFCMFNISKITFRGLWYIVRWVSGSPGHWWKNSCRRMSGACSKSIKKITTPCQYHLNFGIFFYGYTHYFQNQDLQI